MCVNVSVCMCASLDEPLFVRDSIFFFLPLTLFLSFIMSSSFQIFCVRNKVNMRNFTGGCGKNTLDYMVWKYESVVYTSGQKHPTFLTAHYPCITPASVATVILKYISYFWKLMTHTCLLE